MSESLFPPDMLARAIDLVDACRVRGVRVAAAESCTGGLVAALLTEIPGASDVLDRAFVTYSDAAKSELLDVPAALIRSHGAVSAAVATAMAEGALGHSRADLAVAVTGIAGPSGGSDAKPVGLVWFALAHTGGVTETLERRFGAIGRTAIRLESVKVALDLLTPTE